MNKVTFVAALLACCLAAGPAWSEDTAKQAVKIDPVEVRAIADTEPPNSPFRLPASSQAAVWSVDQAQIQAMKPNDLFDVLAFAPGVQLSYQGRKGMNFISSRGGGNFIGGTSFAILIDGAYIPFTQSSRVLANFPLETIESIRVVRDTTTLTLAPISALGSIGAAVQGVVIIKTRKPAKQESQIKLGYGNLNRYQAFLSHGDKLEHSYYSLAYGKKHDDGRDGWNNASDSDNVMAKIGFEQNGLTGGVSFYYDGATREIQRALSVSKTADARWEYDPMDTLMATLSLAKQWNPSQATSLGLYTGRVKATTRFRCYSGKTPYSEHDLEDNVLQADLRHIVTTERNNLRLGGQAILWSSPYGQFYYQGVERDEQLYSTYVYDEFALTKALSIDAGARVDFRHVSKGINKYAPTDATPSELIRDQWAKPSYSVAAGVAYRFNPAWQASLRASFVQQGADNYLLTKDDQELSPEKQMRYEAGLIGLLHEALRLSATAFYYDIKDLKQAVGSVTVGDEVYNVYANADSARSGMELQFDGYLFTRALTYVLGYTYQRSENDKDDRAIPHHIASLRLGYRQGPVQCNLMMRFVSGYDSNQFAVDNQYHDIGDFSRVDASVSYDFDLAGAEWRATVFAQNLTDERYQTRLGWEDVGRTYGVEIGVKF